MRKEDGLSAIALILIIVILGVIATLAFNKVQHVVDDLKETDVEYNKTEIVEKLNLIVKEKYVKDYKFAQENNKKIEEVYK